MTECLLTLCTYLQTNRTCSFGRVSSFVKWFPVSVRVAALMVLGCTHAISASFADSDLCPNILALMEQSKNRFVDIRGTTASASGEYKTAYRLVDAAYCSVREDVEKASYQCVWKFAYNDQYSQEAFALFTEKVRDCIGDFAAEHIDQPVNHPDFYYSHYFKWAGGQVSVSLKNKISLQSKLLSIRIDGN